MRIQELLLNEVMNSGFAFKEISKSKWLITIPSDELRVNYQVSVVVETPTQTIHDFKFTELSFRILGSTTIHLEDIFQGSAVFKLLNTIAEITANIKTDVVVFIPNDIDIDIGIKKARVYMAAMRRMQTRGLLARIEEVSDPSGHIFQFCFPADSKAASIDSTKLEQLAVEYFGSKV